MNNLLYEEPPLVFSPKLAACLGMNQAILLQQLHYWLQRSDNERDGFKWVYNSIDAWQRQFPFWSPRTVWSVVNKLEQPGIIVSGNYNQLAADRTKWYRIDYEKLDETISQGLRVAIANVAQAIPETTTENTGTTTNVVAKASEKPQEFGDPKINAVITNFEQTFGLKLKRVVHQRRAASRLIKSYGELNVLGGIRAARQVATEQYAPQILSLEDLWEKWDKLSSYYARRQAQQKSTVTDIED